MNYVSIRICLVVLVMSISKVGHNFGTSLRRHTQSSTHPNVQSSDGRNCPSGGKVPLLLPSQTEHYEEMRWWKGSKTAVRSMDVQSPHWLQVSRITFSHKNKYKEKMFPTDRHYLFNIAEEMQFPAARCAQGDSICMNGKSASSSVER